ncbi:MAG: LTA synthase family protein [Clostridium sp.]
MNNYNQILKSNRNILFFGAILFVKLLATNFILGLNGIGYYTVFGWLSSVFFFVGLGLLFEDKNRDDFLVIVTVVYGIIIYINILYNRCYGDIFSSGVFFYDNFGSIIGEIFKFIRIYDFIFFLDLLVLIILYKKHTSKCTYSKYLHGAIGCITALFISTVFSAISVEYLKSSQQGILKNFYDKKTIAREIGLANYGFIDVSKQIEKAINSENQSYSSANSEVAKYFSNREKGSKEFYNAAEGKNLLVIQLEAFQSFLMNRSINGVEITPNLNKLSKESVNFTNYYFQIGAGGTSDAEFLSNTSLLPLYDTSVYTQYGSSKFETLPLKLKEKGYYTSVMHANRPGFWNRYLMYKSLGFDVFESEREYSIDEKLILGLSDESFFNQSIDKIKGYKQPFYTFMISLTSHYPFVDSTGKLNNYMDVGELEGTVTGNLVKSARYTDEMLGKFIEKLKKEGLYENTVLAIYGDHGGVSYDRANELAKLLYGKDTMTNLQWEETQKVVSMIHIPGSNIKGDRNIVAGQYDLYPTLANLYGIDTKYTLGRDLLNSKTGYATNSGGNIFTDNAIYIAKDDKLYKRSDYSQLKKEDYFDMFNKRSIQLQLSEAIIKGNLLK